MVGGDEARPSPQVTRLALELVVLPHSVRSAGVGAGRALQDDLCSLPGDAVGETKSGRAGLCAAAGGGCLSAQSRPGGAGAVAVDGAGAGGGWPRGSESRPLNPTLAKSAHLAGQGRASLGSPCGGWRAETTPRPERQPRRDPRQSQYLPKAPYVLTILRGLKEVFMTCLGLSKLTTTGMLSQASRTPRARLAACRTMQPGLGERGGAVDKLLPPGPGLQPQGGNEAVPCPVSGPSRPWPLSGPSEFTAEGGAAGALTGSLPTAPISPSQGHFLRLMWKLSPDNCPYGVGLAIAQ